ncbi:MAG: chromate transporter [Bacteroidales bacterium]|nr:chromate transporter [Bacteroidales bacterium]MBP3270585.1 chromate transporter [Bacteroidales bacterium]
MVDPTVFFQLFWVFFVIGMFTFGGGYAMLSLIQTQVVTAHSWITESAFTDIVAISQMTPGPIGINCATYVGYEVIHGAGGSHLVGILGSLTATIAVVLPSFLIVLTIVRFYTKFRGNKIFEGVMGWLRPAVVGLIGAAAIILMVDVDWSSAGSVVEIVKENFPDWISWVLFAAAAIASLFFKVGPIKIIIAGGVLGLLIY